MGFSYLNALQLLFRVRNETDCKTLVHFFERFMEEEEVLSKLVPDEKNLSAKEFRRIQRYLCNLENLIQQSIDQAGPGKLQKFLSVSESSERKMAVNLLRSLAGGFIELTKAMKRCQGNLEVFVDEHHEKISRSERKLKQAAGLFDDDSDDGKEGSIADSEDEFFNEDELEEAKCKTILGIERVAEYYVSCALVLLVMVSLGELLGRKDKYEDALDESTILASNFLKHAFPLFERGMSFDAAVFKKHVLDLSVMGLTNKDGWPFLLGQVILKFRLLHSAMSAMDIYLFPKTIQGHKAGIKSISFSTFDDAVVMTAGYDRLIRIWDTRKRLQLAQFAGHRSIVTRAVFSHVDDKKIVSSSADHTVRIWDAYQGTCMNVLQGHEDSVLSCDISSNDKVIASCSMDKSIRIWKMDDGVCVRVLRGHTDWVKAVRFTPQGPYLFSAALDRHVVCWDMSSEANAAVYVVEGHGDYVLDIGVSPFNTMLVTASRDRTIKVWDFTSAEEVCSVQHKASWGSCLQFSEDGRYFAVGSYDNYILIYHTPTVTLRRAIKVNNGGVLSLAFSLRNQTVVLGTSDGCIQVIPL
eukprot:Rmarinus@m.22195